MSNREPRLFRVCPFRRCATSDCRRLQLIAGNVSSPLGKSVMSQRSHVYRALIVSGNDRARRRPSECRVNRGRRHGPSITTWIDGIMGIPPRIDRPWLWVTHGQTLLSLQCKARRLRSRVIPARWVGKDALPGGPLLHGRQCVPLEGMTSQWEHRTERLASQETAFHIARSRLGRLPGGNAYIEDCICFGSSTWTGILHLIN